MFRHLNRRKEMTYILGARCKNGVVLVGDRKVSVGDTGRYEMGDKIFRPFPPIVWGSSGYQALYDSFNNRVNVEVRRRNVVGVGEFLIVLEDVYEQMAQLYGDRLRYGGLSVLFAQRAYKKSELWLIEQFGHPQRIDGYRAIGRGEPYAEFFLKHLCNRELTMKQVARLGYFIIKYIEEFQLDNSVGIENQPPDIWFIPDNPPDQIGPEDQNLDIHRAESNEVDGMGNYVDQMLGLTRTFLTNLRDT